MKDLNANDLRALIRLIPQLRALREDVERGLHLETTSGAGDLAVNACQILRDQIAQITVDGAIEALRLNVRPDMKDRQKFSQVLIVSGQLLAYVEAQTGVPAGTGKQHYQVQTAPNVSLNMGDVVGGEMNRVMDMLQGVMRGVRPPNPPEPPRPPRPPRGPEGRGPGPGPGGKQKRQERDYFTYVNPSDAEYEEYDDEGEA